MPRKIPDYPRCPACHRTTAVNYISQQKRGMRFYTCARCKVMFFYWGPRVKNPRRLVDHEGKVIVLESDT